MADKFPFRFNNLTKEDLNLFRRLGDQSTYGTPGTEEFMPAAPLGTYDITEDPDTEEGMQRLKTALEARKLAQNVPESAAVLAKQNVNTKQPLLNTLRQQARVSNAPQDIPPTPPQRNVTAEPEQISSPVQETPKTDVAELIKKLTPQQPKNLEIPSSERELLGAQDAANNTSWVNNLIGAGQTMNEALTRSKYDRSVLERIANEANRPVEQFKDRQANELADMKIAKERGDTETALAMGDPNHPISVAMRELLKKSGFSIPENTSALQLEKVGLNYATVINAEARKEAAKLLSEDREERRAEKKAEKEALLNIPGFERDSNVSTTPQDVNKLRQGLALKEKILQDARELGRLYEQKGPELLFGDERDLMNTKVQNILADYKEALNLGVLQKLDEVLLRKIIPDPTTMTEFIKGGNLGISQDSFPKRLQSFQDRIENDAKEQLRLRGYSAVNTPNMTRSTANVKEEIRLTKDGKLAAFDPVTKQFLGYK